MRCTHRVPTLPFRDLYAGHAIGAVPNAGIARNEAGKTPVPPAGILFLMMHKTLPLEQAVGVCRTVWQGHLVINGRDVLGRHANFHHFDIFRCKQYPMADFRWLDHTVTSMQPEFRALILIDKINPASDTENQLKSDRVIMHHIRHGPTIGNADMAGNDRAAEPVGNQIAVMHPGTANHPGRLISKPPDNIAVLGSRRDQRRITVFEQNPHAIWRGQFAAPTGDLIRIRHKKPQIRWRRTGIKGCIQPDSHTMARQNGHCRIVCREYLVQPKTQCFRKKGHVPGQAGRWHNDLGKRVRQRLGWHLNGLLVSHHFSR